MTGGWFMKFMALILPTKNTKLPVWNETDDTDDTCYIYIYTYIYIYIPSKATSVPSLAESAVIPITIRVHWNFVMGVPNSWMVY